MVSRLSCESDVSHAKALTSVPLVPTIMPLFGLNETFFLIAKSEASVMWGCHDHAMPHEINEFTKKVSSEKKQKKKHHRLSNKIYGLFNLQSIKATRAIWNLCIAAELYGNTCVNIAVVVVQNPVASDFHRQKNSRLQRNNDKLRVKYEWGSNANNRPINKSDGRHLCHRIDSWVLIKIAVCGQNIKVLPLDCTHLLEKNILKII